jgi:hypothetical protein
VTEKRIIKRDEWGARYRNGTGWRSVGNLEKILHHSVTVAPDLVAPFDDDFAAIRTLERIGQSRFGYGISYSFPITPSGLIFEGVSSDRIGTHTTGHNTIGAGIVWVGNYQVDKPTDEMIESTLWLLDYGVETGLWKNDDITYGHRDLKSTACPGDNAYALIKALNEVVAVPVDNPVPAPAPAPSVPRNADGSERLVEDGDRGRRTVARWQEVMGTTIDAVISRPDSALIRVDQNFLNNAVQAATIRTLTGKSSLVVDGDEGWRTIVVRQFYLYNTYGPEVLGRGARWADFDRVAGPETTRLHQRALNKATARSGRY